MSSSNNNVVATLLNLLISCFAPKKEQPNDSPTLPPANMSSSFSYADAVASNVDPPTESYVEPPAEGLEATTTPQDDHAVEEALSEAANSVHKAAAQLWRLDTPNRLKPGVDYQVNIQRKARSYEEDNASEPFFEYISDSVWERPTWRLFKSLLDNYTAETGIPERQTQEELAEESDFLDAVLDTPVGQFTRRWLAANTDVDGELGAFKSTLHDLWFKCYRRDASRDSSGFEHAFCGELDDGKVKGMHNFVQVYVEEQRNNFNYLGFLTYGRDRGEYVEDYDRLITIRFQWLESLKPASSMFVGVSPEFELMLYSMIWLAGAAGETVELGAYDATIKIFDMRGKIGSAFPELADVDYNNPDAYLE